MDAPMGRLAYLPAGVSGPDPDAFLSDVLTGWRRAQLAQNFSTDTARRRVASVLRMTDFVGSYPWQWTPADADDFFGNLRGVLNRAHTTVRGGLVPERNLWQRMRNLVDELGFPPGLDLHSFRRSYATNLQVEYGYDVSFVQLQLGHEHASTTSIYTVAAPDYRARELQRVLTAALARSNVQLGGSTGKEP